MHIVLHGAVTYSRTRRHSTDLEWDRDKSRGRARSTNSWSQPVGGGGRNHHHHNGDRETEVMSGSEGLGAWRAPRPSRLYKLPASCPCRINVSTAAGLS
jgi:hypothetical protein